MTTPPPILTHYMHTTVLHTLYHNITSLAIITRKRTTKIENLKGGEWKRAQKVET